MDATELCFTPASELAELIRAREVSPVELIDAILARIESQEPRLNAFAYLAADDARAAAREAEAAIVRGDALGPLHGIPVTIKDLTLTAGVPTERGSHTHVGVVPEVDAPFVTRLKHAGAIPLGKTTTSEFGWKGVSESPLTGITHNPWKHGYNAGASSAGASVAAAAGYGPLHQGSDGAGSIRMPAHFCGIFGLKPTLGRVPNWPVANSDNIVNIGPITRTVADAALMLRVMAGPHPWDHTSLEAPPADYPARLAEGVAGLKVAFSVDLGHARVDPEVASLVANAVRVFDDLGCAVEPVTPDFGPDGPDLIHVFWQAHLLNYAYLLAEWEDRMDPGLLACIRAGQGFSAQDYLDGVAAPMRDTGLAVTGTVREGNPAAEIVAEAEKEPDSVVTMSTHGRAGIARWALGSVADKVLHTSSRPLMTVRVDNGSITTPEAKLSRIIAPLDGSPVAEESLSTVRALARALGVGVTLVRVHSLDTVFVEHISAGYDALMKAVETEGEEYLVGISTRLRDEGVSSVDHKMVHGRPSDGIAETAQAHEGSIVVMLTHGRTGLSHWMMGSVTDSVVRQCGVPVLILRPAEGALKKKS